MRSHISHTSLTASERTVAKVSWESGENTLSTHRRLQFPFFLPFTADKSVHANLSSGKLAGSHFFHFIFCYFCFFSSQGR